MCLAVCQTAGHCMTTEEITTAWQNNSDGGGYAFINNDGGITSRKFMELNKFLSSYEKDVNKHGDYSPFAVHFRLATHGDRNLDNCHPFPINKKTVMIHNGILPAYRFDTKMSDSYSFATNYLSKMPRGWMDDICLFDMVEEYCHGSKLVILTVDPEHKHSAYIINESLGKWNDTKDMWFSNMSHCPVKLSSMLGSRTFKWGTGFKKDSDEIAEVVKELSDEEFYLECMYCSEIAVDESYGCQVCDMCNACERPLWSVQASSNVLTCDCYGDYNGHNWKSSDESSSIHTMSEEEFIRHYAND